MNFFENQVEIEDKLDKDVMALTKHLLQTKKISVWNVFYPLKANYLKTLSYSLESFFFGPSSSIEMINNIKVKEAREFYVTRGQIDLDIDRQYQLVDLNTKQTFDNYKYNQTFTSMMNSFFIDVIKKLYMAM